MPTVLAPGSVANFSVPAFCLRSGSATYTVEVLFTDAAPLRLFFTTSCDLRPTTCAQLNNCSYHGTCINDTPLTKACACNAPWWIGTDCSDGLYPMMGGVLVSNGKVCPGLPFQLYVAWGTNHVPFATDLVVIFTSSFAIYDALLMSNSRKVIPTTPIQAAALDFVSNDPGSYIATKVDLTKGLYIVQSVPFTVQAWGPPCYANCTTQPCIAGRGVCTELTGVCGCTDSYFGASCEYGCAALTLVTGYGGQIADGSGPTLTAKGLAACSWRIRSNFPGAHGVRIYFTDFDIENPSPVVVQGTNSPADGPPINMVGAAPPAPISLSSTAFTLNFTTTSYIASHGFTMRWYSLGCPQGSFIDEAAGGPGVYSPQCRICPAGSYTPSPDQLVCTTCAPGFVAASPGSSQCMGCRPGSFRSGPGGAVCTLCPAGSAVAYVQATECVVCTPGYHAPDAGNANCLRCNVTGFASGSGATTCTPCPLNTMAEVNGADSLSQCVCAPRFYHPNATRGQPCVPCPQGATCPGGVLPPAADPGYWMSSRSPFRVLKCVEPDSCPGGAPDTCVELRKGKLCAICPFGTTRHRFGCRRCSSLLKVALPLGIIFVVIMLTFLYKAANLNENDNLKSTLGLGTALGLWIQYLQFATLFRSFDVRWPAAVTTALGWFSIVNLDLTVLAPSCSLPMSYVTSYYLRLCIPLFLIGGIILMHIVHPLHSLFVRSVGPWMVRRLPEMGSLDAMRRLSMGVGVPARVRITARLRYWLLECLTVYSPMRVRSSINACLLLVEVFYIFLISTVFEPLGCMPNYYGEVTLVSNPEILCYGRQWWDLMKGAIIGMIVYCLFVPAVNLYAVWRVQSTEGAMSNEHFAAWATFSSIVFKYKRPLRWWMFVILARKLTISVVIATYPSQPLVQVVGGIVGLVVALIAQFVNRPYRLRQHNKVEAVLLVLNTILLLCGILFYTGSLSNGSHTFVTLVCFALLVISTIFMIRVIITEVIRFFKDSPIDRKSSYPMLFERRHLPYDPAVRLILKRVGLPSVALFRYLSVADDDDVNSLTRVAVSMSLGLKQAQDMSAHGLKVWASRYLPRALLSIGSSKTSPPTSSLGSPGAVGGGGVNSGRTAPALTSMSEADPWLDTTNPSLMVRCSSSESRSSDAGGAFPGDDGCSSRPLHADSSTLCDASATADAWGDNSVPLTQARVPRPLRNGSFSQLPKRTSSDGVPRTPHSRPRAPSIASVGSAGAPGDRPDDAALPPAVSGTSPFVPYVPPVMSPAAAPYAPPPDSLPSVGSWLGGPTRRATGADASDDNTSTSADEYGLDAQGHIERQAPKVAVSGGPYRAQDRTATPAAGARRDTSTMSETA